MQWYTLLWLFYDGKLDGSPGGCGLAPASSNPVPSNFLIITVEYGYGNIYAVNKMPLYAAYQLNVTACRGQKKHSRNLYPSPFDNSSFTICSKLWFRSFNEVISFFSSASFSSNTFLSACWQTVNF